MSIVAMHHCRVELRQEDGTIKTLSVMAKDNFHAKFTAYRQTELVVLSTEFME